MYKSREDAQLEAGTWNLWKTGVKALIFCCPICEKPKILRQDVLEGGRVVGNVRCIEPGCGFNREVLLLGWPEGEEYP